MSCWWVLSRVLPLGILRSRSLIQRPSQGARPGTTCWRDGFSYSMAVVYHMCRFGQYGTLVQGTRFQLHERMYQVQNKPGLIRWGGAVAGETQEGGVQT
eukprot:1139484-Pelagomonas_calceolata.AAC.2